MGLLWWVYLGLQCYEKWGLWKKLNPRVKWIGTKHASFNPLLMWSLRMDNNINIHPLGKKTLPFTAPIKYIGSPIKIQVRFVFNDLERKVIA